MYGVIGDLNRSGILRLTLLLVFALNKITFHSTCNKMDYADNQPINQDNTAMEVVEADDKLSWGAPIPDDSTPDTGDTDIDLE